MTQEVAPKYLSVIDAEVTTGISAWTWRRWAYSGKIASNKVSTRLLIPASEVTRVMEEGSRPRTKQPVTRTGAPAIASAQHG